MKNPALFALALCAALVTGCSHAEPEPALPSSPSFAADREKIQNDTTLSPQAKQSALQNIDRMEAQSKK